MSEYHLGLSGSPWASLGLFGPLLWASLGFSEPLWASPLGVLGLFALPILVLCPHLHHDHQECTCILAII